MNVSGERRKRVMKKIEKISLAILLCSSLFLIAFLISSLTGTEALASIPSDRVEPCSASKISESLEGGPANGIVPLTNLHLTNTRYITLLPGGTYRIDIVKEPENSNEKIYWSSNDETVAKVDSSGNITAESVGNAIITASSFGSISNRRAKVTVTEFPTKILNAPYISQLNGYPNGCESVSAVMALHYYDINIPIDEFIDKYLDTAPLPQLGDDGELWGYSPWQKFLGDPRDYSGLCCYAPVIARALEKCVDPEIYDVLELHDVPVETLCLNYIMKDCPVIFWGTMYMYEPYETDWEWHVTGGKKGEVFKWVAPIHCLLLIGFDNENYYFNDPTAGAKVAYLRSDVELAYKGLFSQAVVLRRK